MNHSHYTIIAASIAVIIAAIIAGIVIRMTLGVYPRPDPMVVFEIQDGYCKKSLLVCVVLRLLCVIMCLSRFRIVIANKIITLSITLYQFIYLHNIYIYNIIYICVIDIDISLSLYIYIYTC